MVARNFRTRAALTFAVGMLAAALPIAGSSLTVRPAQAAEPGRVTFEYTGAPQTWTVPDGVTSVAVDLWGAQGGGSWGGSGGRVQATLSVTPGQELQVNVGGAGGWRRGGFNGGGGDRSIVGFGGGGASDIRVGTAALPDRVVVAAGGGGAGWGATPVGGAGGAGGGLEGGAGADACGAGGGGGTQTAGGAGHPPGMFGLPGTEVPWDPPDGGGGGGYYAGGAGQFCGWGVSGGGGGGGGSSWTHPTLATDVLHKPATRRGHGLVVIAWPPAASAPSTAEPGSVTFTFTGDAQWWMVPDGVTAVLVDLYGAQGGGGAFAALSGSGGRLVRGHVKVPVRGHRKSPSR